MELQISLLGVLKEKVADEAAEKSSKELTLSYH
jgi:hypothetical protein